MKFISSRDEAAIEAYLSRENAPENERLYSCDGVYMHGKLQDDIGYDIPILLEGEIQRGINICEIQFPSGEVRPAVSFIWDSKMNPSAWKVRGLIVYVGDPEFEYAFDCFYNKVENL